LLALNFPALRTAPGLFVDHDMVDRTLSELQVEIFDRLRPTRMYARLRDVVVVPSDALPCGWRAEIRGNFTIVEHDLANEIVRDLQRRFSLRTDPLDPRRGSKAVDVPPGSDPSDIT
jgi:hypothetical protein